jgi:hypothetical protein
VAERIRAKAMVYLPADYTVFVRVDFVREGNRVQVVFWIDDPAVSGVSGLLARRAWRLSLPILSHVVREAMAERLQTLLVEVDESKAKVAAFAPARTWYSPGVIALVVAGLSALYWLYAHPGVAGLVRRAVAG